MRVNKLLSILVTLCLLVSTLGTVVLADTTEKLLFDMDISKFERGAAGESWGIVNKGVASETLTIKANDGLNSSGTVQTGTITKESYTNAKGETVNYLLFDQLKTDVGNYTSTANLNSHLWIEDSKWAEQPFTAEVWMKASAPTNNTTSSLFRVFGAENTDRSTYSNSYFTGAHAKTDNSMVLSVYPLSTSSSNTTQYTTKSMAFTDGEWMHVTIKKEYASNGNTKPTILVNGEALGGTQYYTKNKTEVASGLLFGNAAKDTVKASPDNMGIASIKIYDGVLTTAQIKAHYEAEVYDYTGGAETLTVESALPAAGSEIYTHNVSNFSLTFNNLIDEETLEEGVVFANDAGTEFPVAKVLSDDKKTVMVTPTGYLPTGTFKITVTEKLMSLNGKYATPSTTNYNIKSLSYDATAENGDFSKWNGKGELTSTNFNATEGITGYVTINEGSTPAKRKGEVADNVLSIWGDGVGYTVLKVNLVGEISSGTVILEYEEFANGSAAEGLDVIAGGTSYKLLRLTPPNIYKNSNTATNTVWELDKDAGENAADDWFTVKAVFTRTDETQPWGFKIYVNDILGYDASTTFTDALTGFSMSSGADGLKQEFKSIKVRHELDYVGTMSAKMLSGNDIVYYIYDTEILKDMTDDGATVVVAIYSAENPKKLIGVNFESSADITGNYRTGTFTFDESLTAAPILKLIRLKSMTGLEPYGDYVTTEAVMYTPGA